MLPRMEVLLVLCCIVSLSLAQHSTKTSAVVDYNHKLFQLLRKRDIGRRDIADDFNIVDVNSDGHITGDELATVFAKRYPEHTYTYWKNAFILILPKYDTNKNGMLELDEFAALSGRK